MVQEIFSVKPIINSFTNILFTKLKKKNVCMIWINYQVTLNKNWKYILRLRVPDVLLGWLGDFLGMKRKHIYMKN